jgi:hypothetical protein
MEPHAVLARLQSAPPRHPVCYEPAIRPSIESRDAVESSPQVSRPGFVILEGALASAAFGSAPPGTAGGWSLANHRAAEVLTVSDA